MAFSLSPSTKQYNLVPARASQVNTAVIYFILCGNKDIIIVCATEHWFDAVNVSSQR